MHRPIRAGRLRGTRGRRRHRHHHGAVDLRRNRLRRPDRGQAGFAAEVRQGPAAGLAGRAAGDCGAQGTEAETPITQNFTITVSNPGAGNRYYIDGVLQATIPLLKGFTYTFNQTDSSNSSENSEMNEKEE